MSLKVGDLKRALEGTKEFPTWRLREKGKRLREAGKDETMASVLMDGAADEIERLRAEVKRARAKKDADGTAPCERCGGSGRIPRPGRRKAIQERGEDGALMPQTVPCYQCGGASGKGNYRCMVCKVGPDGR